MRIEGIGRFVPQDARDRDAWDRLRGFCAKHGLNAFSRDPAIGGHVTGSGLVLSPDRKAAALVFHRKLGRWLQPGGHCDGIADAAFVALKEAYEETGLSRITLLSQDVLDVDIHDIPARASEPAHLHYDVRFLMQAEAGTLVVSNESTALEWVPLRETERLTTAQSVLRLRDRALRLVG